MPVIEARQLTKEFRRPAKEPGLAGAARHLVRRRYTTVTAVRSIDLRVDAGEAVAYMGANGAGKSTTIKLLTGIMEPTSGEVTVNGLVPYRHRAANARRIGVLFGHRTQLWWDLPVADSIDLLRHMYRIPPADFRRRLERFDELLQLGELLPIATRQLSLGQRVRADLACALLHNPAVVYLDEPTIGLDISVKDGVRKLLKQLTSEGTTILLTTHDLGDIKDVCDRLVLIDKGNLIFDGGLDHATELYARRRRMRLQFGGEVSGGALRLLLPAAEVTEGARPGEMDVVFDRFDLTAASVLALAGEVGNVIEVRIDEPGIEDVVRRIYAGGIPSGDLR